MLKILLALTVILISAHVEAAPLVAKEGKTEFLAVGRPSALKIKGSGEGPTGDIQIKRAGEIYFVSGTASVDLSKLETGITLRDNHMKENYLEVAKHKDATLTLKDAKLSADVIEKGGVVTVPAVLALHGKENQIEVEINVTPKDKSLITSAKFKIKLSDYAIAVPKYAGITVADEVQVTTETIVSKVIQ